MEDLLHSKITDEYESEIDDSNNIKNGIDSKKKNNDIENENQVLNKTPQKTYVTSQLVINYKRWRHFLITWKRLELLKLDWGRRKLGVESINKSEIFSTFS
jgi:hypothetical protein